ncbi:hypothetical protein L3Q67_25765 [Saccharothrix sp. AJ9571]|nr:hypothetical protein L3Q67_25765 [Saccharothrix sp. AJ9571]
MTEQQPGTDDLTVFARQAFTTGGNLHLLAERMTALNRRVEGYSPDDLTHLASSLRGMALRTAMSIDDPDLLNDLSGRSWHELGPGDVLGGDQ